MVTLIDRRQQGGKSHVNKQRFDRKQKKYIREAAKRALEQAGITGETQGQDIHIPAGDLSEPSFHHGPGGIQERVHPGNDQYTKGDTIDRPQGGGGGGRGSGSGNGGASDDFIYHVNSETIDNMFFEDLGLPFSMREHVATDRVKYHRAGVVTSGTPNNRNIVKTAQAAIARRMVQNKHTQKELAQLTAEFESASDEAIRDSLLPRIERLKGRRAPFLDPIDERFRNRVAEPIKETRAVMFAMMDVSGSMDDNAKYMSRLYFTFLYRFLRRQYDHVEIVLMRYHDKARICDDANDFFHGKDSGGTSVTNALNLVEHEVEEKYNPEEWDIFCAQAGDGDTGIREDDKIRMAMRNIMSYCQYFTNIVVAPAGRTKELHTLYEGIMGQYEGRLATRQISQTNQVLHVFRELFRAKTGVDLMRMEQHAPQPSFGFASIAP